MKLGPWPEAANARVLFEMGEAGSSKLICFFNKMPETALIPTTDKFAALPQTVRL